MQIQRMAFLIQIKEGAEKIIKRYKGDVYFIISERTFSSAVQLATIVKDNHLFKVIGEPHHKDLPILENSFSKTS